MSKSKSVPKQDKMKKVPAHILADVELGEGRWFRLVPSFAGGNLDSGINSYIIEIHTTENCGTGSLFF